MPLLNILQINKDLLNSKETPTLTASFSRKADPGKTLAFLYCLLTSLFATDVLAESTFQYSGFGTLGLTVENDDELAFLRDNNQTKDPKKDISPLPDSVFGIQLSAGFTPRWRATTQFVYRDRPEQDFDALTELAFFGYRPIPDLDIRLGRMAVDMFQLSDYRRVDYANLWIRPPTEFYGWVLPSSLDGGDLTYHLLDGEYFWRFRLQHGKTETPLDIPDGSQTVVFEFNDYMVASIALEFDNWRGRISYSRAKLDQKAEPFLFTLSTIGQTVPGPIGEEAALLSERLFAGSNEEVRYWQASLSYDDGDWIVDTEIAKLSTSDAIVPTGITGYFSIGHRLGAITPYIVYSRYLPDQEPYETTVDWSATGLEILRDAAINSLNGVLIDQYTHTLGLRWDAQTGIAIKVQWDRSHIEKQQKALWAHDFNLNSSGSRVDLFSIAFNFIF